MTTKIDMNRRDRLDALSAILPAGRVAGLASALTPADLDTLRHLARAGAGPNTLRALASDLTYIEAWAREATGRPLPWPASLELVLKFVAHHLWDPAERECDPAHGMPSSVDENLRRAGVLRARGPHAPATVRRRIASWSTLHHWRDTAGPFGDPALRQALRLASRSQTRRRAPKSREALVVTALSRILAPLDAEVARTAGAADRHARKTHLAALRDRAVLSLGFAAGGRRRSEIAGLRRDQIDVLHGADGAGVQQVSDGLRLHAGRSKTTDAETAATLLVRGRAVRDVLEWLTAAGIATGAVFRPLDRWGHLGALPLTGQSVNAIVKRRCLAAGIDPRSVSAHGLRSGYLTEAALQSLSLPEAMRQSGHRSAQQAASYFNAAESARSRAAELLE